MVDQIIGLHDWLPTPAGQYLLQWEQAQLDAAVADIFGYHALQLGVPELDALRANRMPHRWLATEPREVSVPVLQRPSHLQLDFTALPFAPSSLDLVVLPHTLERSTDPRASLREVERVLVPEGRVVICGFNSASLWGWRQRRGRWYRTFNRGSLFLPDRGGFLGYGRLRDWLRLLGFELEVAQFGCYRPAINNAVWLDRMRWMDEVGARWWPILGAAYCLVAVKRVRGMRLLGPAWKPVAARAGQAVSLTHCNPDSQYQERDP